jgi:hypothetical protein
MRVYDLANTTGTGNQTAADLSTQADRDEALLQIEFATTGSVTVEGRIDSSMSWITIAGPYTADTIVPVAFVPSMRLAISANGSGIVAKVAVA